MSTHEPRTASSTLGELDIHWLEWGPKAGPTVFCLHGFPDTAHTWRHLGPALADQGFHVMAPWLRGYAPSAVPADGNYRISALVGDLVALVTHVEANEPILIGHDWGAIIGYAAVASSPDLFSRLVTMAVPPISTVMTAMFTYAQIRRSWYMFVFQHALAEGIVAADDLAFIDGLWADWSPGYEASEDLAAVKESLRQPANLGAAIGYYRAMLGPAVQDPDPVDSAAFEPSPVPTLYLHGADDGCMGVELVQDAMTALIAPGSRADVVDHAGHFLHLERPDAVNQLVVEFLT